MSEPLPTPATPAPEETESEVRLDARQEALLRAGLHSLPVIPPHADFNARVLAAMTSGRDFDPWWRQVLRRARWMLLPAAVGFGTAYAIATWQERALPTLPPPYPRIHQARPAPPLPALPAHLRISHQPLPPLSTERRPPMGVITGFVPGAISAPRGGVPGGVAGANRPVRPADKRAK
ncbi:MAG TPA: hypothetical protein VFB38_12680 [Chthonomonadaceae bacterium]|nr:hypothetical protein [Chthonomonadaceae bacterium]